MNNLHRKHKCTAHNYNCGITFLSDTRRQVVKRYFFTATEWIGKTKRSYASCLTQVLAGVGQCIQAGIVYFMRDWRIAQFIMGAPIVFVAVYIWYVCI